MRSTHWTLAAVLFLLPPAPAQQGDEKESAADSKELTLERLFPEKSFFGPSARAAKFSHDGRYVAWLWRPWLERRHGSDLWLHDIQSGETRRLTSAVVLATFQMQARKVVKDRSEKARKKSEKEGKKEESEGGEKDRKKKDEQGAAATAEGSKKKDGQRTDGDELGDVVDEDDAEDEEAPRHVGVSEFRWSPVADELLFVSGSDVYRWVVGGEGPERLTRTRDSERGVRYLPAGDGYTYQRGNSLMRVVLGSHVMEQLDPELPEGETLSGYELSPDGLKVALLARKSERSSGGRTVNIVDYGERFMKVRQVPRRVSDDPMAKIETIVYLYRLPEPMRDDGELVRVYTHEHSGPRDTLRMPDWAPDSSKAVFAVFEQSSEQVHVLEADFPPPQEEQDGEARGWDELVDRAKAGKGKKDEREEKKEKKKKKKEEKKERDEQGEGKKDEDAEEELDAVVDRPARVVYRFLHAGGPTTPRMINPTYLADSRRVVLLTELAGFRHLHLLDPVYETLDPLTRGRFEVYPGAMPEHREWMVVSATREHSSRRDAYRIDFENGGMTRLTPQEGSYTGVAVSPDGGALLANFVRFGAPRELVRVDVASGEQTVLTDSHPEEARELTAVVPELFEYENRHGQTVHGFLFKPEGWKQEDRRPLLIYVYGGPLGTRKEVTQGNFSSSAYLFAWYMTQIHGYVTCTIDPRGMSGYGAVFEKANFERVGEPQVEDLVDGVKYLVANAGVDPERVGIHGWSFGGFQTQMCMYTEPDVFACGIAGAGPTEWENYNSWYSTGTIGKSRTGSTDLEKYSLLPLAKNLEGRLLLVHGMEDSNVLYQDTVRVYGALLKAGKETLVELFLDPSGGHGLGGHIKRLGRYRKYEEFLVRNLGSGAEPPPAGADAGAR